MGQNTRFDDSKKTRLIDDASIGINDNPVVGEESIECARVIVGNRSREFIFYIEGAIQAFNEKQDQRPASGGQERALFVS